MTSRGCSTGHRLGLGPPIATPRSHRAGASQAGELARSLSMVKRIAPQPLRWSPLARKSGTLSDRNRHELRICPLGPQLTDLFEVRLRDTRREKEVLVGLSDVGFGISQILPLVVQSLAGTNQIITIEQPEVHIHPRLQADLGDLLIEATREPRRNQFIIETHSEHLALRLQRRVREKKLAPSDISVLFVSRGPDGATVQPMRLDDEGDFIDDFPGGFFPERLRELR